MTEWLLIINEFVGSIYNECMPMRPFNKSIRIDSLSIESYHPYIKNWYDIFVS